MKFLRFPNLLALLLMVATVFCLSHIGAISVAKAFGLVVLFQVAAFLVEPPRAAIFVAGLTASQTEELTEILESLQGYESTLKILAKRAKEAGGLDVVFDRFDRQEKELEDLRGKAKRWAKSSLTGSRTGIVTIGGKDFVPDACASALTSHVMVMLNEYEGGKHFREMFPDQTKRDRLLGFSRECLGLGYGSVSKTALDSTTIPLPTLYMPQIVELVWKYGQARQFGTVYPLGAGTVKLPRLQAGEDQFTYLGVGTAGMSQAVGEKRVTATNVTFTANKMGGIVRIPTEIEEDSFIQLGQFLARYIARQLSKVEDLTMFLGDGTSTYANITGVGPYCATNTAYLRQLASGKTKPTDSTINDFRAIRGLVNPAVLVDDPAYYMNPTMEGILVSFNTIGQPLVYRPQNGTQPATLDGFPIRWVGVMQANVGTGAPSAYLAFFGSLQYWYLGERGAPRVEVSREVYFATDEIGMRALERIDVEAMGIDAMAALQTAAS